MPEKNYLDDTPFEETLLGGKLITAREGFLVGKDNFVELRNMRYSTGGIGVETRLGMRRFNGTAIGTAADIEKIWQHLYTFEQTQAEDVYCVTDERKLYKADSIPEASAGSGSLGSSLYDFSTGAAVPSFCNVDEHAICSSQKDLIGYSGATPYPTAVLYGIDIGTADTADDEDDKTFQIISDEVTNSDTTREVQITLDTQANTEAMYVGFFQPIRGITWGLGSSVNNNDSKSMIEYWDGNEWVLLTDEDGLQSDGSLLVDDMSDLTDWTDEDANNGASTQVAFDGSQTMKLLANAEAGSIAQRMQDMGSFAAGASVTIRMYIDTVGTKAATDHVQLDIEDGTNKCLVYWDSSNKMYVYDGASWNEVGTDELTQDTWIDWTFVVAADFSTVACYKDGTLISGASAIDCSYASAGTDGHTTISAKGTTVATLAYVDIMRVGDGDTETGDSFTDGTASSGATMAQDGATTWTYIAEGTEQPRRINGLTLFWYRLQVTIALDAVDYRKVTVLKDWRAIQDLTDGRDIFPSGFLWFDDGDDPYNDMLDRVLTDTKGAYASFTDIAADTDIAAADVMYVGFPQRVIGMKLYFIEGYTNGSAATITASYWNGTGWTAYAADELSDGTLNPSDSTKMFNQTGEIRLEDKGASIFPTTIAAAGIKLPFYWYKIDFSAKLYNANNDEIRMWKIRGIPAPMRQDQIENCQWVSNFKQRLWRFGPEGAPNLGEFSGFQNPYALSGFDTSSTWPRMVFGSKDEIICAVNFFNEIIVFKRREVWMMEGDSPDTFGTLLIDDTLGCVAPETAKLVRTWITLPDGRRDFRYAVFFMSHDGIWGCDGLRCWKVSEDIENYFNQKYPEAIKAGYRSQSRSFFDPLENEYHFFIWSGSTPTLLEFIYNTEYQRMAGPFVRSQDIVCGESVIDSNDDRQSYGGGDDGRMYRLEYGANDVDDTNIAVAINNWCELGDGWTGLLSKYAHRGVFLFGKAQSSGDVNVDFKGDGATTGIDLGNISMVRAGYSTFIGRVNIGGEDSAGAEMENKFHSARLLFSTNAVDVRQELFGFLVKKGDVSEAATI